MRRFPSSWDVVLTTLGFKRKHTKRKAGRYQRRRSRLEQLEPRQLLSISQQTLPILGDFNGDGRLESIATGAITHTNGNETGTENWQINTVVGPETWTVYRVPTAPGGANNASDPDLLPEAYAVGDFNGDGRDDILARFPGHSTWSYAESRNQTAGEAGHINIVADSTFGTDHEWGDVLVGDFNGDGRDDVAAYTAEHIVEVAFSVGHRLEEPVEFAATSLPNAWNWSTATTGDFNGDGRDDIWVEKVGDSTTQYLITSDGHRGIVNPPPVFPRYGLNERYVGDFDGDGADEIAGRTSSSDPWRVLQFNDDDGIAYETGWGATLQSLEAGWTITVGDIDRDGRDDLIGRGDSGDWSVSFSQEVAGASGPFASNAAAGDWFDGYALPGVNVAPDPDGPYQDVLDLFSEVYNNVELELYAGLMKGPQATDETQAGNPWDQAALLVDKLEAAGFDADIVYGEVEADTTTLKPWLGALSNVSSFEIVKQAFDSNARVFDSIDNDITFEPSDFSNIQSYLAFMNSYAHSVRFKHAWVQVSVPTATGMQAVQLDPSWKFKNRQEGVVVDLTTETTSDIAGWEQRGTFDEFEYLASADRNDLPVEWYEEQVMQHLAEAYGDKSLADIAYEGPIVQRRFDVLPTFSHHDGPSHTVASTMTPEVLGTFSEIVTDTVLAERFAHRFTIAVSDASSNTDYEWPELSWSTGYMPTFSGLNLEEGQPAVTGVPITQSAIESYDSYDLVSDGDVVTPFSISPSTVFETYQPLDTLYLDNAISAVDTLAVYGSDPDSFQHIHGPGNSYSLELSDINAANSYAKDSTNPATYSFQGVAVAEIDASLWPSYSNEHTLRFQFFGQRGVDANFNSYDPTVVLHLMFNGHSQKSYQLSGSPDANFNQTLRFETLPDTPQEVIVPLYGGPGAPGPYPPVTPVISFVDHRWAESREPGGVTPRTLANAWIAGLNHDHEHVIYPQVAGQYSLSLASHDWVSSALPSPYQVTADTTIQIEYERYSSANSDVSFGWDSNGVYDNLGDQKQEFRATLPSGTGTQMASFKVSDQISGFSPFSLSRLVFGIENVDGVGGVTFKSVAIIEPGELEPSQFDVSGGVLEIGPQAYKAIDVSNYAVTHDTVLDFDFKASAEGEAFLIELETINGDVLSYPLGGVSVSGDPVYGQGDYGQWLDDVGFRVSDHPDYESGMIIDKVLFKVVGGPGSVSNQNSARAFFKSVDLIELAPLSYGKVDAPDHIELVGTFAGTLPVSYRSTARSYLEFDFKATELGDVHAIGWSSGSTTSSDGDLYQIAGEGQDLGQYSRSEYRSENNSGSWRYNLRIPLANDSLDNVNNLVFVNEGGRAEFTNLRIVEEELHGAQLVTRTFVVPAVALDSVRVDYANHGSNHKIARLIVKSDGTETTYSASNEKPLLASIDQVEIATTHTAPSDLVTREDTSKTYYRGVGEIIAVGLDANQHSTQHLVRLQERLTTALQDGDDVADIDELLAYTSARYWHNFNESTNSIDRLMRTVGVQQWVGSGLVTADPVLYDITGTGYEHLQFPILPVGLGVDLPNLNHASYRIDTGLVNQEAFQLVGWNSSALENAVLEEVVNTESISTIRGLKNAFDDEAGADALLVFERQESQVYFRGAVGESVGAPGAPAAISTAYSPTNALNASGADVGSPISQADFYAMLGSHQDGSSNPVADDLWGRLINGSTTSVSVVVPYLKSEVGDWLGSVNVAEFVDSSGNRTGSYAIRQIGGPITQGGYSGGIDSILPPSLSLPTGSFTNQTWAGDPVSVANGNMFRDEVDFTFPNLGLPLDFTRHYDSQNDNDVGFGVGWVHSFTGVLYLDNDDGLNGPDDAHDKVVWLRGDGSRHTFEWNSSAGQYDVPSTLMGDLEASRNTAGSLNWFFYREKDGTIYWFGKTNFDDPEFGERVVGRLGAISNQNGNLVVLSYEQSDNVHVAEVTDWTTKDREVQIEYFPYVPEQPLDADNSMVHVRKVVRGEVVDTHHFRIAVGYHGEAASDHRLSWSDPAPTATGVPSGNHTFYRYYYTGNSDFLEDDPRIGMMKAIHEPGYRETHLYEYYLNRRTFRVKAITDAGADGALLTSDDITSDQTFTYDLFRNVTEFTDENGNTETYHHRDDGLLERQQHADGSYVTYAWGIEGDPDEGLMLSNANEVGATEVFEYYGAYENAPATRRHGELKSSVGRDGLRTEYEYFVSPAPTYAHISELSKVVVDPDGEALTTVYGRDDRSNLTKLTDALGNETKYNRYAYGSADAHLRGLVQEEVLPKGREKLEDGSSGLENVVWQPIVDSLVVDGERLTVRLSADGADPGDPVYQDGAGDDYQGHYVVADAIRIDRLDADGVTTWVIDDSDERFQAFVSNDGELRPVSGVHTEYGDGATLFKHVDGENNYATWTFEDLLPGTYRVSTTWVPFIGEGAPRDASAKFDFATLHDPNGAPYFYANEAFVDQQQPPSGFQSFSTQYEYDTAGNLVSAITEELPAGRTFYDHRGNVVLERDATGVETVYEYNDLGLLVKSFTAANDGYIDFSAQPLVDFSGQTGQYGTWEQPEVLDNGRTLKLDGNIWRAIQNAGITVGANTVLEFDFKSTKGPGEGHDILFSNSNSTTASKYVSVWGTQERNGTRDLVEGPTHQLGYELGDGWRHYRIAIGASLAAGTYNFIAFANDDDGLGAGNNSIPSEGDSYFSNVRIYDEGPHDDIGLRTFTYYVDGRVSSSRNALWQTTFHHYDNRGRASRTVAPDRTFATTTYDGVGNVVSTIDAAGAETRFVYDDRNRLVQTIYADGSSTGSRYDGAGRLGASIDALGAITEYAYDEAGRRLSASHELEFDGDAPETVATTSTYDAIGRLVETTDAEGVVTRYRHDRLGRVVETRVLASDSGTPPVFLETTSYDSHGQVSSSSVIDAAAVVAAGGSVDQQSIDFTATPIDSYHGNNGPQDKTGGHTVLDSGRTIRLYGNSWKAIPLNYEVTPNTIMEFVFEATAQGEGHAIGFAHGNQSSTSLTKSFNSLGTTPPNPTSTTGVYDYRDYSIGDGKRLYRIPVGEYLSRGLHEYLVFINDDDGNDPGTGPDGGEGQGVSLYTELRLFEDLGSLVAAYPDAAQTTSYRYDALGQLVSVTHADGEATRSHYDGAGRLRFSYDELGRVTESQYDAYGRLAKTILPDPDGDSPERESPYTRFVRDREGRVTHEYTNFGDGAEQFDRVSHDAMGRANQSYDRATSLTRTYYDATGRVTSVTDPLGNTAFSRYDELGRAIETRLADPDGEGGATAPVSRTEYDAAGRVARQIDARGDETWFAYDSRGRLRAENRWHSSIFDNTDDGEDSYFSAVGGVTSVDSAFYGQDYTWWLNPVDDEALWSLGQVSDGGEYRFAITASAFDFGDVVVELHVNETLAASFDQTSAQQATRFKEDHAGKWIEWVVLDSGRILQQGDEVVVKLVATTAWALVADAVRLDRVATTKYEYDNNGALVASTDTLGRTTDYEVDELGRTTSVELPDPDGGGFLPRPRTDTTYDGFGNVKEIVEHRGGGANERRTVHEYDKRNRVAAVTTFSVGVSGEDLVTSYEYDEVGNVVRTTDPLGVVTVSEYDDLNQLVRQTEALGEGRPSSNVAFTSLSRPPSSSLGDGVESLSPDGETLTITGDGFRYVGIPNHLILHNTVLELELHRDRFDQSFVVSFDNDGDFGGGNDYFHFRYVVDISGQLEESYVIDSDASGALLLQLPVGKWLQELENLGFGASNLGFYQGGDPSNTSIISNVKLYETDAVTTEWTYDVRGNVISIDTPSNPSTDDAVDVYYEYDQFDRVRRVREQYDESDATSLRGTSYSYDAVGSMLTQTLEDPAGDRVTTYLYDDLYRQTYVISPDPDTGGGYTDPAPPTPFVNTRPFDEFVYDPLSNVVAQTNAENETTRSAYNGLGLVTSSWDGNGDETRYEYDSEGNLTAVLDAEHSRTTFEYDNLNRLTKETNNVDDYRENYYDSQGNLAWTRDRESRYRIFSYDSLDRVEHEFWYDVEDGYRLVLSWQYDNAGRVVHQKDLENADTFAYDDLGRLVEQTNYDPNDLSDTKPNIRREFVHRFSADVDESGGLAFIDRVFTIEYRVDGTGGETLLATAYDNYDPLGRLSLRLDWVRTTSGKQLEFAYNVDDTISRVERGHYPGVLEVGPTTEFSYDKAGRVTSINHQAATNLRYELPTYDNANRIRDFHVVGGALAGDKNFDYDQAGQLTDDDGVAYSYDDNGNRLTADGAIVVTDELNRVVSDGTYFYEYDREGNRTRRANISTGEVIHYLWDHRNRLTEVQHTSSQVIGEVGSLTVSQASENDWTLVTLDATYLNPVVFAYIATENGADPAVTRVRNVGPTSFEVQVDEWDYLDGIHADETVNYLVVEAGEHELAGGLRVVAGTEQVNEQWASVNFSTAFDSNPAVLSQAMTYNGTVAVTPRHQSVSPTGFQVRLQEEQAKDDIHYTETVGYIAIEGGDGYSLHVGAFEVASLGATHDPALHTFAPPFAAPPVVFAAAQTYDGTDTAGVQTLNLSGESVGVKMEEEASADAELEHAEEQVALVAFASAGLLRSTTTTDPYAPPTLSSSEFYVYNASDQIVEKTSGAVQVEHRVYNGDALSMRFTEWPGILGPPSVHLTNRYVYGPTTDQAMVDEAFAYDILDDRDESEQALWLLGDHQNTVRALADTNGTIRKEIDYDAFGRVVDEAFYREDGSFIEAPVLFNFREAEALPYDPGDQDGANSRLSVANPFDGTYGSGDGLVLLLTDNTWKAFEIDYEVTGHTVLQFEFYGALEGEIHGFYFDTDLDYNNTPSEENGFRLWGTDTLSWNTVTNEDFAPGQFVSYTVPIGQYFTGHRKHLVLLNDNDVNTTPGVSLFKNVRLYEADLGEPPPPVGPYLPAWLGQPEDSPHAVGQSIFYAGRTWDEASQTYDFRARRYDPTAGRFLSEDPLGLSPDPNLYRYVGNSPVNFVDPSGLLQAGNPLTGLNGGLISHDFLFNKTPTVADVTASLASPSYAGDLSALSYLSPTSLGPTAAERAREYEFSNAGHSYRRDLKYSEIQFAAINPNVVSITQVAKPSYLESVPTEFFNDAGELFKEGDYAAGLKAGISGVLTSLQGIRQAFVSPSYRVEYNDGSTRTLYGDIRTDAVATAALGRPISQTAARLTPNVLKARPARAPLPSAASVAPVTDATRARVLANIAESRAAREASNIGGGLSLAPAKISSGNAQQLLINRNLAGGASLEVATARASSTVQSFRGPITVRRGLTGEAFEVFGDANLTRNPVSGVFVTRGLAGTTSSLERQIILALPNSQGVRNSAIRTGQAVLTRDQLLLEGAVRGQQGGIFGRQFLPGGANQTVTAGGRFTGAVDIRF